MVLAVVAASVVNVLQSRCKLISMDYSKGSLRRPTCRSASMQICKRASMVRCFFWRHRDRPEVAVARVVALAQATSYCVIVCVIVAQLRSPAMLRLMRSAPIIASSFIAPRAVAVVALVVQVAVVAINLPRSCS